MKEDLLLIFPHNFYSFNKFFVDRLTNLGYRVKVINDVYPSWKIMKGISRISPLLVRVTTYWVVKKKLQSTSFVNLSVILIIRGKGVSSSLIKYFKSQYNCKIIGYNWDSFINNPSPLKWLNEVDKYFTFDYADAEKYSLNVIDLFSSQINESNTPISDRKIISTVISNHSNRIKFIDGIINYIKQYQDINFEFNIYIYEKNIFVAIYNFLKSPVLFIRYYKFIHRAPLSYYDYIQTIKNSLIVIDYSHDKQAGITMRTFEAISNGAKLISNNKYIMRSNQIDDNDYFIIKNLSFSNKELYYFIKNANSNEVRSKPRSLESLISELLN